MSGDYTRFTFDPLKRYSGVQMQQGRVQLDSDWNEEIDILRRRIRTTTLDVLGPVGVPYAVSPDAFKIGWLPGPPADLSIGPGRLYVDGIQVEAFAEDRATYGHQPFFPPPLAGFEPPPLPGSGSALVYLDVWEREVTYIEDPALLDVALGGADTTTRRQTVWQVRVDPADNAACGAPVGEPPSTGRLTSRAIAPPAPDDPCILPPASGYRGLENRLYRVEIHGGGPLGTATFKWSRDNGSIVSVVRDIAVSGAQTTLSVNRIGRDQFLRFRVGDWVTVTDDHRELTGETGEMALIVNIDEANRQIVVDRALPTPGRRPFGANVAQIADRHTRVQRWDQSGATNTVDPDGLVATGPGPIPIEDGIEVSFSTDPAGGSFRVGDYWFFWARTATAQIEELTNAPPRGIIHHYVQLAAITGLGGTDPVITDCRPPQQQPGDCCCTIIVRPGESIQAGIDALPAQGGCVCLKTGLHVIRERLRIVRSNIMLKAESPGTTVRSLGSGPVLEIGNPIGIEIEGIEILGIDFDANGADRSGDGVVMVAGAARVRISHCGLSALNASSFLGVHAIATDRLTIASCRFGAVAAGILVHQRCEHFEADENILDLAVREGTAVLGIAYIDSPFPCRITRNTVAGAMFGIAIDDQPFGQDPHSLADLSLVRDNIVLCPNLPEGNAAVRPIAIAVAANGCTVSGNRVRYANPRYIGIRVTGSACRVEDNQVLSSLRAVDPLGPVAIQIGVVPAEGTALVSGGIVAHNAVIGPQHGIVCIDTTDLVVEGNLIGASTDVDGVAILAARATASQFSGNQAQGALAALLLSGGSQNRIAANVCRNGGTGISLSQEGSPQICGNRCEDLKQWGVRAEQILGRLDVIENRVARCGAGMSGFAFAVGMFTVAGEAHVLDNEVLDTGSNGGPQASPKADYGIAGDLVLEARISGNLVTYSNALARDPSREDRALIMRGLSEQEVVLANRQLILGFPAQIDGNKFTGNGRTALVELLETVINDKTFIRFERVSFSQNYCWHISPPDVSDAAATVSLRGRRAIVIGNHIKATTPKFFSINFNGVPGPFIGNVTAGGSLHHTDFPVAEAAFNLTSQ